MPLTHRHPTHTQRFTLSVSLLTILPCAAHASVTLPHVFGDHMVLQRNKVLPVWGWAEPGEKVTVQLGNRPSLAAAANDAGEWRVDLPSTPAGGPFALRVKGKNEVVLNDVLVGEVWLCSGQSNMAFAVGQALRADQEAAAANYPQIRHLTVPRVPQPFPVNDFNATWQICSPATVRGFSACAYFFGRDIHRELGVPVGLINSSWGGTRIEPWTPPVGFGAVPALAGIHKQVLLTNPKTALYKQRLGEYLTEADAWLKTARQALTDETVLEPMPSYPKELRPFTSHQQPTMLYNGMIHPLVPFALRGALWYQGESNHVEGKLYTEKTKALVRGWREVWRSDDLPYYYVQIAPYHYNNENPYLIPAFWEAQADALQIPHTGMVVTNDIGNVNDIHPKNKQEVGRRLALLALARTYGKGGLVDSGPTFKSLEIEGAKIRLHFDNVGGGLASRNGKPLTWFKLIGKKTDFVDAKAEIDGDTVVVSAPEVKQAAAVRFAWHRNAEPNLMNKEGLPARPFRAGTVPERDYLAINVPEAKDYQLVYSLDLAKLGKDITYDQDLRARVNGPFDRVAYFLELQKPEQQTQWIYVSMDAFTKDLGKTGIPTVASKAAFQQKVADLNVLSNVEGIVTGIGLTGGNVEFWPHNYGPVNASGIPNASSEIWDFGDQRSDPVDGYGCMQVHNFEAKQTLFAVNSWKSGAGANLGIGNSSADKRTRDWTFVSNAKEYSVKKLRVLVRVNK